MQHRRKLGVTLIFAGLLWMIGLVTGATFSDRAMSSANTIAAGTLYMSVDGQCGDRVYGGGGVGGPGVDGNAGCEVGAVFVVDDVLPGGAPATHTFEVENLGSLTGILSADILTEMDQDHPACSPSHFTIVAGPLTETMLGPGGTSEYTIEVSLSEAAPNACQGASLVVDVVFDLVQA